MKSIRVFVSPYGEYLIPSQFADVRFTKKGWVDKRNKKRYREFFEWVGEQDRMFMDGVRGDRK